MNIDGYSNPSVKILFIGDSGLVKTSIISLYDTGEPPINPSPTVGAAYLSKIYKSDDIEIELRMWDTAGQETYQSLAPIYFLHSLIGFIVFDITQRSSYLNVAKWVNQLREFAGDNVISVIVANKIDLESERQVYIEEYSKMATELNSLIAETSAVSGEGINTMINNAVSALINSNNEIRYEISQRKKHNEQVVSDTNRDCC